MTPQALKNSILQLAIQGKLVEQRPEEGTGKDLFQQIQEEKRELVKAGKIKKEKPLLEITEDEIPFDIPENWIWARFGDICTIDAGGTPDRNTTEYWGGNIPWVKIGDIRGKYVTTTSECISQKGLDNSSAKIFPAGTLLYTIFATIGTVGILSIDAATNQAIAGITLLSGVDTDYMYHVSVGLKYLLVAQAHGMAQMNINQKILKSTPIPLPPLAEQKRIVAKIEELLPLIDRYEQAWSKLEEFNKRFPVDMQKSILQMAIQGKLVPQLLEEGTGEELFQQIQAEKQALIKSGKIKKEKPLSEIAEDEIPFDIPDSWRWCRLSELAVLENGDRSSRYPVDTDYVTFGIPFLGAKDMSGRYMSFDNVRYISETKFKELGNGKLQDKDFICLLRGSVGKISQFKIDENHKTGFICAQMVIIRSVSSTVVDYLYTVMTSPYYFSFIESKTTGTAVRQLPAKELGNILIPLPPLAEQKRIVAKLEEILPLCERLK